MGWKYAGLLALLPLASCQTDTQYKSLSLGGLLSTWSPSCVQTMNTTIPSCPGFLLGSSITNYRFTPDQLTDLCTSSCQNALASTRQNIVTACTSTNDTIEFSGTVYPVSIIIDKYIYAYNVGCRKDATSGAYCDSVFYSWLDQSTLTSAQNCSDCNLGVAQLQLNSPFGYDDEFAAEFSSLTSSCGATQYAFTSPAPYSTVPTSSTTSTSVSTSISSAPGTTTTACVSTYVVKSGDSCNSIALANNISTYGVINAGGVDAGCSTLQAGASLCLPGQCTLYQVQDFDNCTSIISKFASNATTATQFLSWNANINSLCGNIEDLVGTYICVSPPGGVINVPPISTPLAISTATTPVPKPTNAPPESNSNCAKWYTIQDGDTCNAVAQTYTISLKDFYFLNPEINSDCTNLLLGLAYCVMAVGNIGTYSGYPTTSQYITLTSEAFNTTTETLPPTQPAAITPIVYLPTAPGTIPTCTAYVNYTYVSGIVDQSQSNTAQYVSNTTNQCDSLTGAWDVTVDDLVAWNPSLANNASCALQPGFSYCVLLNSNSTVPDPPQSNHCLTVNATMPGTIESCNCFTTIDGYDNSTYTCDDLAYDANITIATLQSWNPWIGSNCATGLYANMTYYDQRAVCIGVNGTGGTTTSTPTSTTTPGSSTTTTSMGPTLSGTVPNCLKYYTVQSGDGCDSIEAKFSITFAQFYAWNTEIGDSCQNLWLGYAYCVSAPTTTTTGSPTTTTSTPAPTRSGTAAGCSTYYTVQTGDGCQSIETKYNISFQQLYNWNTNIGDNCQSLWVGYSLCVAGGPS